MISPLESPALEARPKAPDAARPHVTYSEWSRTLMGAAYAMGLALATVLLVWTPVRFAGWAASLHDRGHLVAAVGVVALGTVGWVAALRWLVFFGMSRRAWHRMQRQQPAAMVEWPFVSILVPAYNESETIEPALQSLLALDYPDYEILVIDDGSKDDTLARARRFEGDYGHCRVRLLHKPNGGKWSALNAGFHESSAELLLCVDADSRLDRQSLRLMVQRMAMPGVDAVAGQVRVRNRNRLLTWLQGLEYILSNGALRMAQAHFGSVLVIPGPLGLFRRSVLEELCLRFEGVPAELPGQVEGPFQPDTFAEDFDLSLSILSLGGRTVYEPAAVSHTKAPDSTMALLNQRYRWCRGTIQVLRKYVRRARRDPRIVFPRLTGWLVGTYAFDLVLQPLSFAVGLGSVFYLLATGTLRMDLLVMVGLFQLLSLSAAVMYSLMHSERLRLVAILPFYDLYHGFVISGAWAISVFDEVRNVRMRW